MERSQEQKRDLVESYFCYPITPLEDLNAVLERLIEYHDTSTEELEDALKFDLTYSDFYCAETRQRFVEVGYLD